MAGLHPIFISLTCTSFLICSNLREDHLQLGWFCLETISLELGCSTCSSCRANFDQWTRVALRLVRTPCPPRGCAGLLVQGVNCRLVVLQLVLHVLEERLYVALVLSGVASQDR